MLYIYSVERIQELFSHMRLLIVYTCTCTCNFMCRVVSDHVCGLGVVGDGGRRMVGIL